MSGAPIPWLDVARFHAELVRRAEADFFALPLAEPARSDRWLELSISECADLAGPWQFTLDPRRTGGLQRSLTSGARDPLFLGIRTSDRRGSPAALMPLLYRAVRAELEAGTLRIEPDAGEWDVNPLILQHLNTEAIVLGSSDDAAQEIVESVHRDQLTGLGLIEALRLAVQRVLPSLATSSSDVGRNPALVLFAPPAAAGNIVRNLLRDYDELESVLDARPDRIGGLRLLDGRLVEEEEVRKPPDDLLRVVPMNDSQRAAVGAMLEERPVTVVSGPPGCGKSQVVVSLLINAWANGQSVLFASNNNQAVDVVRKRLEPLEGGAPIAVRAGSAQRNDVEERLGRIASSASARGRRSEPVDQVEVERLTAEREALLHLLDSRVPQRAEEGLHAALTAYGRNQEIVEELASHETELADQLSDLVGIDCEPASANEQVIQPLAAWASRGRELLAVTEREADEASRLMAERSAMIVQRDTLLARQGVKSVTGDTKWLDRDSSVGELDLFISRVEALLAQPLEDICHPRPWSAQFERWPSAEAATDWATRAEALSAAMRIWTQQHLPELRRVAAADVLMARAHTDLAAHQLDDVAAAPATLEEWSSAYASLCGLAVPGGFSPPWSQQARLTRTLKRRERVLRRSIPSHVWRRLGPLNDASRAQLAEVVDSARAWLRARAASGEVDDTRDLLLESLETEARAAATLGIEFDSGEVRSDHWASFASTIDADIALAREAAEAWQQRVASEEALITLSGLGARFFRMAPGVPLRDVWAARHGQEWTRLAETLRAHPSAACAARLRHLHHEGLLESLRADWRGAASANRAASGLSQRLAAIPLASERLAAWVNEAPSWLLLTSPASFQLYLTEASEGDQQLNEWLARWRRYDDTLRPSLQQSAEGELRHARASLRRALDPLAAEEREVVGDLITPLLETDEPWPTEKLVELFTAHRTSRLMARIELCDDRLGALGMAAARDRWWRSVNTDTEARAAVDVLRERFNKNRGRIGPELEGTFRDALRLAPIWITTAMSAQSIPMAPDLFDLVVIDEAVQCSLTNVLPLIFRAKRLAVIGDSRQLCSIDSVSPGVEAALASRFGITPWLPILGHVRHNVYEAVVRTLPGREADVVNLDEHYRSHPLIIGFANSRVYQQALTLRRDHTGLGSVHGVYGIDVRDTPGFLRTALPTVADDLVHRCATDLASRAQRQRSSASQDVNRGRTGSWVSEVQAAAAAWTVLAIRSVVGGRRTIGVVTPFRAQRDRIEELLDEFGALERVQVGTAHAFQGDERDVMVFSPVVGAGLPEASAHWVEEPPNLINVAVTRARDALFVVGDLQACARLDGILGALVGHIRNAELARATSAEELDLYTRMIMRGWNVEVHARIGDIEVDLMVYAPGLRLAVEVDGLQHTKQRATDQGRDAFLRGRGFDVYRVTTREVRDTPEAIMAELERRLSL